MPGETLNHAELREHLLGSIGEACAQNCNIARARAGEGANFVLGGNPFEVAQEQFTAAAGSCAGPEEIKVCGAEEGKKTYRCRKLGELMSLSFDD